MNIAELFILFGTKGAAEAKAATESVTAAAKGEGVAASEAGKASEKAADEAALANKKLAESFDVIKEHAGEMASRLVEHALEVAAAFQALFAVEKLVDNFFETSEQSDQLGERAKELGVQVEQLDAWGNATKRVGGSAEAFGQSLINVNRQMSRMEATGKSRILPFFKELGVSMTDAHGKAKTLMDLLPELAKATEGKSKQETAGALRGIGFDEGTIRLLQRGGAEVDKLIARQKQLGLVTAEDAETAEKFNIEWDDVKQLFHSVTVELDTYFLPILESVLDAVEVIVEFLRDHKDLVVGFFIALAAAAIYAADAFGILDLAILANPITWIVIGVMALITAFALLYEDIMAFAEGHNSLIGEMVKRWPIIGDIIRGVIWVFKELKEAAEETFLAILNWVKKIPQGFAEWEEIFDYIGGVIAAFAQHVAAVFEEWVPGIGAIMDDIGTIFKASVPVWAAVFSAQFEIIKAVFIAFWETTKAVFSLLANLIVDPEHAFQTFGKAIEKVIADLIGAFPHLTAAFQGVGTAFAAIGQGIIALWHDIGATISGTIGTVVGAVDRVKGFFHGIGARIEHNLTANEPDPMAAYANPAALLPMAAYANPAALLPMAAYANPAALLPGLAPGQAAIAGAQVPLMAQGPGTLQAGAGGKTVTNTIAVGPTTINAPNSSPEAIAGAVDQRMNDHVNTAINHLSDGVSH